MSISDNYTPLKQQGNGTTTEFSDVWSVISSAYLRVYLESVATGVQVLQVEGSDYAVVITTSGFVVTMVTAPTSSDYLVVARDVSQDQTNPYRTSKGFQGGVVENSFDKITAMVQDVQDGLDRTPKTQVGSDPLTFPPYVAGLYLGWSADTAGSVVTATKTIAEVDAAVDLVNSVTAGSGVLVSSSDTTIGFLNTKLVAGTNIGFTVNNPASAETMTIDIPNASETVSGCVEASTTAEMTAGTADKYPDGAKVKAYVDSAVDAIEIVTLGTPVTLTTQTEVTTSSITSGIGIIYVYAYDLSTNGTSDIIIQIGDSGGIETTGYVGNTSNDGGTSSSWSGEGFEPIEGMAASNAYQLVYTLHLVNSATNTWMINGGYSQTNSTQTGEGIGRKSLSGELTQIKITTKNGTDQFDVGTFNTRY